MSPIGVNVASYTPTNSPQSCPTMGTAWAAATILPPTPNSDLCTCMNKALSCVPDTSVVNDTNANDFFALICGLGTGAQCQGIIANATTGTYGAYGMCNTIQRLGWALNKYYEQQVQAGNSASACAFSGSATTQAVVSATGNCLSLINEAGVAGTGTLTTALTNKPTGSSSTSSSGAGSGGGGGTSGSSSGKGSGLSTGTKARIGVGVVLGVIAVIGIIAFLVLRSRRRKRESRFKDVPHPTEPEISPPE